MKQYDGYLKAIGLLCLCLSTHIVFAEPVPLVRFHVNEFIIEGDNPLPHSQTEQLLLEYTGDHEGLDGLLEAVSSLENKLSDEGYSFHRVILPRQTLVDGIVKLEVIVFKVGNVTVTGNQHFSDENIRNSLPSVKQGESPNTREFARQLDLANQHPAKQLVLNMKKSAIEDAIDAEIFVQDQKPWLLFAAINNIGTDDTGEARATIGGQYNNFLDADNILTLTYTTSPGHYGDVKQYGVNYLIPLYDYTSSLSMFYLKSDVNTGTVGDFTVSGAGRFLGASFTKHLPRARQYSHELTLGIQDRLFNDDALFTLTGSNFGSDVRSRPLSIDYSGEYKTEKSKTNFLASFAANISSGRKNTDVAYNAARLGAEQSWKLFRFKGDVNYYLPKKWLFRFRLNGQFSPDVLIPGEQFGIGGEISVRGFEERAVAADSGITGNLELWAPPFDSLNNLRILAFVDSGYKHLKSTPVIDIENDTLISAGFGARWSWKQQFSVSLDYGYVLNEASQLSTLADKGSSKLHVSAVYKY